MPRGVGRRSGEKQCKVCVHKGKAEIDALLLNGAKYSAIIRRMRAAHPEEPELNPSNLSRHKNAHLLTKPIKVTEVDPETGQVQEGYLIGHLTQAITAPKEVIPDEAVSVPDALKVIINAGVRNIAHNPELVTPQMLIAALDMARKIGLGGNDQEEFRDAWKELGRRKGEMTRKAKRRKTTMTVEEEVEETVHEDATPQGDIIDAEILSGSAVELEVVTPEVVTPEEWSEDDLKLLEGGKTDE